MTSVSQQVSSGGALSSARYERRFERSKARSETELDPEVEAEAARRLVEEEAIARKFGMPAWWSFDEQGKDIRRRVREPELSRVSAPSVHSNPSSRLERVATL